MQALEELQDNLTTEDNSNQLIQRRKYQQTLQIKVRMMERVILIMLHYLRKFMPQNQKELVDASKVGTQENFELHKMCKL